MNNDLSVRELHEGDVDAIAQYFLSADSAFLKRLGVDENKLPGKNEWKEMLAEQLNLPAEKKKSYYIIWEVDEKPAGHSNVNDIVFGKEAYMHLHLWNVDIRKKGIGTELVKMTLPYFFEKLRLQKIHCQPNALNTAPNRTLAKVGFKFIKEYTTIPGWLNFEQQVYLWQLSYNDFTMQNK